MQKYEFFIKKRNIFSAFCIVSLMFALSFASLLRMELKDWTLNSEKHCCNVGPNIGAMLTRTLEQCLNGFNARLYKREQTRRLNRKFNRLERCGGCLSSFRKLCAASNGVIHATIALQTVETAFGCNVGQRHLWFAFKQMLGMLYAKRVDKGVEVGVLLPKVLRQVCAVCAYDLREICNV